MTNYRERIEQAVSVLLARGFKLVSTREWPAHFGDTEIVIAADATKLRFVSDRGQIFVDVARSDSPGWFDLSEVLTATGQRSAPGPWPTPDKAVVEFQEHESAVSQLLADDVRRARLKAR
jgi:hypothetical protein